MLKRFQLVYPIMRSALRLLSNLLLQALFGIVLSCKLLTEQSGCMVLKKIGAQVLVVLPMVSHHHFRLPATSLVPVFLVLKIQAGTKRELSTRFFLTGLHEMQIGANVPCKHLLFQEMEFLASWLKTGRRSRNIKETLMVA